MEWLESNPIAVEVGISLLRNEVARLKQVVFRRQDEVRLSCGGVSDHSSAAGGLKGSPWRGPLPYL